MTTASAVDANYSAKYILVVRTYYRTRVHNQQAFRRNIKLMSVNILFE